MQPLGKLLEIFRDRRVDHTIRQAAIWIATSNPSFAMLQARGINAHEVAQALKLCDDAGLDVTQTALWDERLTIAVAIEDEPLREWLRRR